MEGASDEILKLIYKIFLQEQWHSKGKCNEDFINRFNKIIKENSNSSLKVIWKLYEEDQSIYEGRYVLINEDEKITETLFIEILEYLFNEDPEILPIYHVAENPYNIDHILVINNKLRECNSNIRIVIEDKVRVYNIIAKEKL